MQLMSESTDTNRRLSLIQLSSLMLKQDMPAKEFNEITGLIEALCRHSNLSIETCLREPRHEILSSNEDYRKWIEFELPNV